MLGVCDIIIMKFIYKMLAKTIANKKYQSE